MFLETIRPDGLLSFAPGSEAIPLRSLNVIVGPNASGKSNLIEVIELLRATPTGFAAAIRDGGGAREWLWKGEGGNADAATIEARLARPRLSSLRYRLRFAAAGTRTDVVDEALEEAEKSKPTAKDVYFYYRYQDGHPVLNVKEQGSDRRTKRSLQRDALAPDESGSRSVVTPTSIRSCRGARSSSPASRRSASGASAGTPPFANRSRRMCHRTSCCRTPATSA